MKYICKKIFTMLITILLVSLFVFLAFELIPGDPALAKLGTNASPEKLSALREQMGLDKPFLIRYFSWVFGMFRGDFGNSYSYSVPVSSMILDKFPITITLTLMSFVLIMLISIPVGIFAAEHDGSVLSKVIDIFNQFLMAVPSFFAGMLITYFFGLILRLFTPGGFVSYTRNIGKFLYYLIFPSIAIALPKIAMTVKLLRSSIITESKKDYVRTAYSRGNSTTQVLYKHVLRNAMIPVVTFLGMVFTNMIAGSIVVEQVFNIPGLGRILLTSISNRDYPVTQAIILLIAALVIVVNFIVDIIYHILDPRVGGDK